MTMKINLSPSRRDNTLILHRAGEVLSFNGEAFDFTDLPDGATLPRDAVDCEWLAGDVHRIDGVLHLTIALPHGANAPEATRFPVSLTLTSDGPVNLPPYSIEETTDEN